MNYALNPLSKDHYFGDVGEYDGEEQFRFSRVFQACASSNGKERKSKILNPLHSTMREIITTAPFEGKNRDLLNKPLFIFGDHVQVPDDCLDDRDYKWLRQINSCNLFLPDIEKSYPFLYLQSLYP